jgi:hypothetical protein
MVQVLKAGPNTLPIKANDRIMLIASYRENGRAASKTSTAFIDDSVLVYSTINKFIDYYKDNGTFTESFIPIRKNILTEESNEAKSISNDELQKITLLDNPKYVIDLALVRILIRKTSSQSFKVNYAALWRVYDPYQKELVKEVLVSDSTYYDLARRSDNRQEIDSTISEDISDTIAKTVTQTILPYWDNQYRFYMTTIDSDFNKVEDQIKNFQWKAVIESMTPFLSDKDKNRIYAASFNIALACEMTGQFDLALKWLEKCEQIKNTGEVKFYKITIEDRIKNKINL